MYRPLRSEAVAWRVSTATSWRRPVRNAHRSETARPTAASVAALVSPMRNGVGNMGSVPPVISTARARSSPQPAIGKIVRRASLVMVGNLPSSLHRQGFFRRMRWGLQVVGVHVVRQDRIAGDQIRQGHGPTLPESGSGGVECRPADLAVLEKLAGEVHHGLLLGIEVGKRVLLANIVHNVVSYSGLPGRGGVSVPDEGTAHLPGHGNHDQFLQLRRQAGLVA